MVHFPSGGLICKFHWQDGNKARKVYDKKTSVPDKVVRVAPGASFPWEPGAGDTGGERRRIVA